MKRTDELLSILCVGIAMFSLIAVQDARADGNYRTVGRCTGPGEVCARDGYVGDGTSFCGSPGEFDAKYTTFEVGTGDLSSVPGADSASGATIRAQQSHECLRSRLDDSEENSSGVTVAAIVAGPGGVVPTSTLFVSWKSYEWRESQPVGTVYTNGTYIRAGGAIAGLPEVGVEVQSQNQSQFTQETCGLPCPFTPPPPPPRDDGNLLSCWDSTPGFTDVQADECYINQELRFYTAWAPSWASDDIITPYTTQPFVLCVPTQHICEQLPPISSVLP